MENKKYYIVDSCDLQVDSLEEFSTLESVKELLYNAWSDDNSEDGWTSEEINAMDEKETDSALGGIGYWLFTEKSDALQFIEEMGN